jgi:hypothetical protein
VTRHLLGDGSLLQQLQDSSGASHYVLSVSS